MSHTPQFTREDFFRETLNFRDLMGSKSFWAKTDEERDRAVRGYGFVYTNCPLEQVIITTFCATMQEYTKREGMMLFAQLSR